MPIRNEREQKLASARLEALRPNGWDSWFDEERVTEDFMVSRDQPAHQERDISPHA